MIYLTRSSSEQLTQWDSPMRVKLSVWKPCVRTLLIELLPWALLINHSKWDLWLFEGEQIILQIPAGKTMIPPNFQVDILFKSINRHFIFKKDFIFIHEVQTCPVHMRPKLDESKHDVGHQISLLFCGYLGKQTRVHAHMGRLPPTLCSL